MTFNAFGCMRHTATENLEQLMIAVNSMGGHYGKPGQCWGGYYFDGGSDAPCNLILTGSSGVDEAKEKLGIAPKKMLGEPCDDVVSAAQVWDAILNKKYHFTGDIRNDAPESACEERDPGRPLYGFRHVVCHALLPRYRESGAGPCARAASNA